jgi:hypothetical protein
LSIIKDDEIELKHITFIRSKIEKQHKFAFMLNILNC